ncbi:radical SAM/SPASM domain-containing protein [Tropicibacter oceani]|uniref:Radical SAM protein n=1 Tax=Tropicibacter oceani TaxID=3058420 RepID=A0ABY8QG37_9RHOB|nr:radical SAM protein [Tropicibacter oceani]WGW03577.1 radical SAM protein [Tropicibacter oceani]
MKLSRFLTHCEFEGSGYLHSGLSGAVYSLELDDYFGLLEDPAQFVANRPEIAAELRRWYFLVPERLREIDVLKRRRNLGCADRRHLGLTVITSLACNFDCPYCYEDKRVSLIGAGVEQALFDLVSERMPTLETLQIHWLGGEPLLAKRRLLGLSAKLQALSLEHGVRYAANVTTNGFLLDAGTAQALRSAGITHAQVCLDGPPDIHDKMRPQTNGKGSFKQVLENVEASCEILDLTVRVNADTSNYDRCKELLEILQGRRLNGKITIYLGHLVNVDDGAPSPSATYLPRCFAGGEFAQKEIEFLRLAAEMGFNGPALPGPITTPCTAVRPDEFVVGSEGELYKCWENVGNRGEIIGNISDLANLDLERQRKWLDFDPFTDAECSNCVALPSCMGGCRHHQLDDRLHDARCSTFRSTSVEQLMLFAKQVRGKNQVSLLRPE